VGVERSATANMGRSVLDTVDVRDLPEPYARTVRAMVEALRQQVYRDRDQPEKQKVELPLWRGKIIGSLRREDIYRDAL